MQRIKIILLTAALFLSACGGSQPAAAPAPSTTSASTAPRGTISVPLETLRRTTTSSTTTSSTTTTTTTTLAPQTPQVEVRGTDWPLLQKFVRDLYTAPSPRLPSTRGDVQAPPVTVGEQQPKAPAQPEIKAPKSRTKRAKVPATNGNLAELMSKRTLVTVPKQARVAVGTVNQTPVAIINAGGDITLAVQDPEWKVVGGWWPSFDIKGARLGKFPKLVAVIGSDARPDDNPATALADSLHIIGLDGTGAGGSLGIPRDSWESLATGGTSKINAALARGGPDAQLRTLEMTSGLDLDGYILTGFSGFESMINLIGGVNITLDSPMVDSGSHADFDAGRHEMDGEDALAFSRTRKTLSRGDFDRQVNGGRTLAAVVSTVQKMGVMSIPGLLERAKPHYLTDLSAQDLLTFTVAAYLADLDRIPNEVVQGTTGSAGGASVVFLLPGADSQFADLADGNLGE